jgi:hypothetical protein
MANGDDNTSYDTILLTFLTIEKAHASIQRAGERGYELKGFAVTASPAGINLQGPDGGTVSYPEFTPFFHAVMQRPVG